MRIKRQAQYVKLFSLAVLLSEPKRLIVIYGLVEKVLKRRTR